MAKVTGNGSVVQLEKDKPRGKCRRWQLRVSCGRSPRTGKYVKKTRAFQGTYSQACAELRKFIDEIEGNKVNSRSGYTFKEYCEHYLDVSRQAAELAETTCHLRLTQFRAICMHIGEALVESITPETLNTMYDALQAGETLSGEKVSAAYINSLHAAVTNVLELAVEEGIIPFNPARKAKPPKIVRNERRALTPQQAREFVSKLDPGNAHHCAYLLAVSLGLRRGEVCGLSWSDVDLENRTVHVRHNLDVYGNLKEPKTKAGIRMLPMSDRVHEALSIRKRVQAELLDMWRRASLDDDPCPDGQAPDSPVISNRDGTRISPNSLARWWNVERGELGMDGWTLHELRHTYLTTLAVNGVHPKIMQELAGHARMATTLEIYTHVNMDAKREAMRAVSDVF